MKYKAGDKVRIKSLDWYKEQDGLIPSWLCPCCGRVMTITVAYIQGYAVKEVAQRYLSGTAVNYKIKCPVCGVYVICEWIKK